MTPCSTYFCIYLTHYLCNKNNIYYTIFFQINIYLYFLVRIKSSNFISKIKNITVFVNRSWFKKIKNINVMPLNKTIQIYQYLFKFIMK